MSKEREALDAKALKGKRAMTRGGIDCSTSVHRTLSDCNVQKCLIPMLYCVHDD